MVGPVVEWLIRNKGIFMNLNKYTWLGLISFPLIAQSQVAAPPGSNAVAGAAPANVALAATNLPPNVQDLVKLSNAGVGDAVLLAYINKSPAPYDLSANGILQLKSQGISSAVIAGMLSHDAAVHGVNQPLGPDYSQRAYGAPDAAHSAPAPQILTPPEPASPPPVVTNPSPQQPAPAPQVVVQAPPTPAPPPQVEIVTVAPGPDYYWTPGHWVWSGRWVWVGGGWGFRAGWGPHRSWGYGHRGWDGHHR
jgi:hypothetical protein